MNQGIDNALAVAFLFGVGFLLDRWLGTTPWLMIVLTVLGGIGVFAKMKYRYDEQMAEHEAERRERANAAPTAPADRASASEPSGDGVRGRSPRVSTGRASE